MGASTTTVKCLAVLPVIVKAFIPIMDSPVNLLKGRAALAALQNRMTSELVDTTMYNQLHIGHANQDLITFTVFSFGLLVASLIVMNTNNDEKKLIKLRRFSEFSRVERSLNIFILLVLFLFFKNVDSVF